MVRIAVLITVGLVPMIAGCKVELGGSNGPGSHTGGDVEYFEPPTFEDVPSIPIDDVTQAIGYEIVAVDGADVVRRRNPIVTMVPVVLASPGEHKLKLEARAGESLQPKTIVASLEPGKRYRLQLDGEVPTVVEDTE